MVGVKMSYDGEVPELVSSAWCAKTFGIAPATVSVAVREGRLPAVKIGKSYVIRPEDALPLWGHRLARRAVEELSRK